MSSIAVPRRVGFPLPSTVKCADMLQRVQDTEYDTAPNQPLPSPYSPGTSTPESVGITSAESSLIVIGDHGGIEDPAPQKAVAQCIAKQLEGGEYYSCILSMGDLVYFNGDPAQYPLQFYEPYAGIPLPIVGVPGNHDGDPTDDVAGAGIASFMANFVTGTPMPPPGDPHGEYGRDTQTQPSHDWVLELPGATLIGLWSNVKSGGNLYPPQQAFLRTSLIQARQGVPVVVYMHHPPYSVDAMHGGCAELGALLDQNFTQAGRWPEMVMGGHIHDYQRFTRQRPGGVTTYLVVGNSGYHNLHPIAGDYTPGLQVSDEVVVNYADASTWGFLELTLGGINRYSGKYTDLSGAYIRVDVNTGAPVDVGDSFELLGA